MRNTLMTVASLALCFALIGCEDNSTASLNSTASPGEVSACSENAKADCTAACEGESSPGVVAETKSECTADKSSCTGSNDASPGVMAETKSECSGEAKSHCDGGDKSECPVSGGGN